MHVHFNVALAAMGLAACSHPSPSSEPAASVTPADVPANANPCDKAGRCSVNMVLPNDALRFLQTDLVFKVYRGCPRALGFRQEEGKVPFTIGGAAPGGVATNTSPSMRRAKAIVQSSELTVILPRMSGSVGTVGIFYGAEPGKYAVVDFSKDPNQTVKFGYTFSGPTLLDDRVVDAQNRTIEHRICP